VCTASGNHRRATEAAGGWSLVSSSTNRHFGRAEPECWNGAIKGKSRGQKGLAWSDRYTTSWRGRFGATVWARPPWRGTCGRGPVLARAVLARQVASSAVDRLQPVARNRRSRAWSILQVFTSRPIAKCKQSQHTAACSQFSRWTTRPYGDSLTV
jgi:hypothetical protein